MMKIMTPALLFRRFSAVGVVVVVVCAALSSSWSAATPHKLGDAVNSTEALALFLVPDEGEAAFAAAHAAITAACTGVADDVAADRCRVRTLIAMRYAADAKAQAQALALFDQTGTVAGLLAEQDMDGAYRGMLHLVPRLPTGDNRAQLTLAADALVDVKGFFARLQDASGKRVDFRYEPLGLRFFESVKRRTPSAVAVGWTIAYNVRGSLFVSPQRTRETIFHELFHLNDQARGWWSERALGDVYRRIVARCGTDKACLKPYAPDSIVVRGKGGTYYAFMPQNGVTEYAADVAKRYYVEHRAIVHGQKVATPFRCQRPENAEAWQAVVETFFGGVDLVPPCR